MAKVNKRIQKKIRRGRGRPKKQGGPDQVVPVRLPKSLLVGIDLAVKQKVAATRSEVIRRLIEIALAFAPPGDLARHQELVALVLSREWDKKPT